MAKTWHVFPDAEAMAGKVMRDAAIAAGGVHSSVPNNPTYPLITFSRLGGLPPVERRLDRARIQVEAWGDNKGQARLVAEQARRALHLAEGIAVPQFFGFITGVEDELGLTFLPDPPTGRDRYIFAVAVYTISTTT